MPLSEDEQRILQDIERNFYESDPAFAEAVSSASLHRHAKRNVKLAILGFIASFVILLIAFKSAPLVGLVGFLGMVGSTFLAVQNVRRMGANAMNQAAVDERAQQMSESLDGARKRLRKRFGKNGN